MQFRRGETVGGGDVRVRHVGAMAWAPFASSDPVSGVIQYNEYAPGRAGEDWVAARPELAPVMTTSSMYCATYAAREGLGVAFLPVVVGEREGLVQLDAPVAWMDVLVARHPDLDRNARVRLVFDAIVAQAGTAPGLFQPPEL
jgi:DNA-binding transcriptional LysR family regulator